MNLFSSIKNSYTEKTIPEYSFITQLYQPIFILFLILIVFLAKESPQLIFPQIIYLLLGFLFCNALLNYSLTKFQVKYWLVDTMAVFNCVLVTGIIYYSGGVDSYLWVLYLFPIFSAVAVLDTKQAVGVLVLIILLWTSIYGNPFEWDFFKGFDWAGKTALVFIGALFINSFIRERKIMEDDLHHERKKLNSVQTEAAMKIFTTSEDKAMLEIGQRTSKIIHDLGTPVTVILSSARMILKSEIFAKEDVQRIVDASLLCKNIVSNAMQAGKEQEYKTEKINLLDSLESALAITMPLLLEKKITLEKKYNQLPCLINGSFIHIERLFINIITNSKKAMQSGGTLSVDIKQKNNFAEIIFEDNGPGFSKDMLELGPKAFKTSHLEGSGTGLGLVGSLETAKKHGGEVILANRTLGGARITVRLPLG